MNNMQKSLASIALALAAILYCSSSARADYTPPANDRVDLNLNYDWKFTMDGKIDGAEAPGYDDSSWKNVTLPHTYDDNKFRNWISTRNDKEKADEDKIYFGKTWYRKHFTLNPFWQGRKVLIEF